MGGRSRVVVAMSGGVDSAVAAARCRAAGHEVIGISLRLAPGGGGSCCSLDDFHDARALGARWLATGHYARIGTDPATGRPYLRSAVDAAKDQTYFLFGLGPADLAHTLFPVGDLTKAEVRAEAAALGLAVADKPESMEVCFVPGGDVAEFVERHAPAEARRPGPILH